MNERSTVPFVPLVHPARTVCRVTLEAVLAVVTGWSMCFASPPQVTNVLASQRPGTMLVEVTYDLYDASGHTMTVSLSLSTDGGQSYQVPCTTTVGDIGPGIASGTGKHLVWDAGTDFPDHVGDTYVVRVTADDGIIAAEMIWIPAGYVRMGQSGVATPVHNVYLGGFYIDKYEVTNARYKQFIDAGGYTDPALWNPIGWAWRVANGFTAPYSWTDASQHGGGLPGNDNFPVNGLSWWEADAFCRWAGMRLPTEAEWEKAAKGGCEIYGDTTLCDNSDDGPVYPWGDAITDLNANFYQSGDPYENNGWTTPVGYYDGGIHDGFQTQDSSSPYGLYDCSGNVWEWCSTKYATYPYSATDGRENSPATYNECCRVARGGSWYDNPASGRLRCANRDYNYPHYRGNFGFRCAKSEPPPPGMIWIPPGNVKLGQTGVATPVHDVYVEGFYVDRYEVSNGQYKAFIDAGGYQNSAYWHPVGWAWRVLNNLTVPYNWTTDPHGGGIPGNEDFPVGGVSWWEADAYCRWAGGRLPTEAEWEKAAKGGCETHGDAGQCDASDTPSYPWGEGITGQRANFDQSGDPYEGNGWTTPVGYYDGTNHDGFQTIDSPSPYGLYDVAGNVYEWCSTKYGYSYPYNPGDGRENPPATSSECCRVVRGGAVRYTADVLRCANRTITTYAATRSGDLGFRCVRSR